MLLNVRVAEIRASSARRFQYCVSLKGGVMGIARVFPRAATTPAGGGRSSGLRAVFARFLSMPAEGVVMANRVARGSWPWGVPECVIYESAAII